MRGAERPAKVRWSRPFLPVLAPLTYDAARRTFSDIADENHDDADIRELLRLTDHLPLAVSSVHCSTMPLHSSNIGEPDRKCRLV